MRTATLRPFAALLMLLAVLPVRAGVGVWTPIGPDGGTVWALTVDPEDPDTVYAGGQYGIFKSTDGGQTWAIASRGLGSKLLQVSAIVVAPGAVYAGTAGHGIFRSADGGRTWTLATAAPALNILALAVDPRAPHKVWAGTYTGVFFSSNGGAAWQWRRNGLPKKTPVWTLAVDAAARRLYAGTGRGLWQSGDEGRSWAPVRFPVRAAVFDIEIDPGNPAILYAATNVGLYRSQDRGATWKKLAESVDGNVFEVTLDGSRVYVAAYTASGTSFVTVSLDRGATWKRQADLDQGITAFAAGHGVAYAGFFMASGKIGGILRSLDGGATWEPAQRGLLALPVHAVAVDPSDRDVLYAGTQAGLFKTMDGGSVWERLPDPELIHVRQLLVDPRDSSVYAASSLLFRSPDGGETWEELGTFYNVREVALDPRAPGALWVLFGSGLSHVAGAGAEPVDQPLPPTGDATPPGFTALAVDPRDPRVVHVGGIGYRTYADKPRARLFRSADGGKTWERRETGLASGFIHDLAVDPNDSTVYAALSTGLYRSTDGGASWQLLLRLDVGVAAGAVRIAIAPTTPSAVYVAVPDVGVLRSTDRGQTWTDVKLGLGIIPLLDLIIDPPDPRRLYAGTSTRGIYTYTEPSGH